jgi:PTH1 family peptidyl-tRNA hydrolase
MKIVVGLGNPGDRYHGTRHNVGFAVLDSLASSPRAGRVQSRFQAEVVELVEGTEKILLVAPETFMNLSGRSVRQVIDFYQLPLSDLLVVCDDINLPLGKLRVRARGSHGGHNGLRDIQNHLGTEEYARLRIGVDAPRQDDAVDHVLGRFRPTERPVIDDAVQRAAQAVIVWALQGIQECMNQFNPDPETEKKKKDKKATKPTTEQPSPSTEQPSE